MSNAGVGPETSPIVPEWTLGERICKARRVAGLDQLEFAERLSVNQSSVSKWERDVVEPRVSTLRAIADITGVDAIWLFTGGVR